MADKDPAKAREEALEASRKEIADRTAAQLARAENTQPTPTQEENDRAKLGLHSLADLDDKEADGSPEERSVSAADGTAGAKNRSVSTK
jgi:hypothetical protein